MILPFQKQVTQRSYLIKVSDGLIEQSQALHTLIVGLQFSLKKLFMEANIMATHSHDW